MSHSSVTHGHALFVDILPFAHEDDVPQSPMERGDTSTTMSDSAGVIMESSAHTGHHPHHHLQGRGPRTSHSSPTHGHGLLRCPLRSLIIPGLIHSSVTHGHALRSSTSSSSDGETAHPTTPTTPRASRRTTRTSSLFSTDADEGNRAHGEHDEDLSLVEMLVQTVGTLFETEVAKEGSSSQMFAEGRHKEDVQDDTHERDDVPAS
ncbi:hypothetical protein C8T65DRAFT_660873 [Cerioporus squamosus]|nr:hypothetical protein C8T65DRAFT_660873 [Cerioporus squamosus]